MSYKTSNSGSLAEAPSLRDCTSTEMGTKIKAASASFQNRTVSSGSQACIDKTQVHERSGKMSRQFAIGIDIAKEHVELRWASHAEPTQISPSQSFMNTAEGFQAAQDWLLAQGVVPASS